MSAPLLFISGEYPPEVGGVGDYTDHLRQALDASGWPSRILSRRDVRSWDARALPRIIAAAPRGGAVHIQYQAAAFDLLGDICLVPAMLRIARSRTKVVTTFHDARVPYLFPRAGRLREQALELLARHSDAVIAAEAQDLRRLGGPSRRMLIPIGSNVACAPPPGYDRAAFRATLGLGRDALVLAYFGLLNASKGLDLLLDSLERVRQARPNVTLLILGGEIGASDATDRVTAARLQPRLMGLGPRVRRTGWLDGPTLSAHLLAADVAVLPYVDGASARRGSLLACAAHGLPIVSTTPATPEVVQAVCAVAADSSSIAAAVLNLAQHPDERERLRLAAQRLAEERSWPRVAQAHVAVYEQLLYS